MILEKQQVVEDSVHPACAQILYFFEKEYTFPRRKGEDLIWKAYQELAYILAKGLGRSPEMTIALRRLHESRDSAIRALRGTRRDFRASCKGKEELHEDFLETLIEDQVQSMHKMRLLYARILVDENS